jgi:hypothetical protein
MLLDQPRADVAEVEEENRGGRMRMDRRIAKQNPKYRGNLPVEAEPARSLSKPWACVPTFGRGRAHLAMGKSPPGP